MWKPNMSRDFKQYAKLPGTVKTVEKTNPETLVDDNNCTQANTKEIDTSRIKFRDVHT